MPTEGGGSPDPELGAAWRRLGVSVQYLWIGYFGVGGNGTAVDVERWCNGVDDVPDREHNFLAQALNDEFMARDGNHRVAYRTPDTPAL